MPLVTFSSDLVFDGDDDQPVHRGRRAAPAERLRRQQGRSRAPRARRPAGGAGRAHQRVLRAVGPAQLRRPDARRASSAANRGGPPPTSSSRRPTCPTWSTPTLGSADRRERGIWHLTNDGAVSWFEFARAAARACGAPADLIAAGTGGGARLAGAAAGLQRARRASAAGHAIDGARAGGVRQQRRRRHRGRLRLMSRGRPIDAGHDRCSRSVSPSPTAGRCCSTRVTRPPDGHCAPSPPGAPPRPNAHLRWHPLRGEWVAYAGHRQHRTFLPPPEYNPLAPSCDRGAPDRGAARDAGTLRSSRTCSRPSPPTAHDPPTLSRCPRPQGTASARWWCSRRTPRASLASAAAVAHRAADRRLGRSLRGARPTARTCSTSSRSRTAAGTSA